MKITLIAAMDSMGGIGKNGTLPWHIPEDLKHFKEYTAGKVCVMGRKTWDSLPVKPLPNRECVVISTKAQELQEECKDEITCFLRSKCQLDSLNSIFTPPEELCIIGGASIYEQFLPHATHMVLTHINGEYGCDTFFPEFNKNDWTLTGGKQLTTEALVRYWERKQ